MSGKSRHYWEEFLVELSLTEIAGGMDASFQAVIDGCTDATQLMVSLQFLDGPQAGNVLSKTYLKENFSEP